MTKRPMLHFTYGMIGYVATLILSIIALTQLNLGWVGFLIALIPVVPLTYGMAGVFLMIRKQDELVRRMHLESVLISAFVTGAWTFSWGLLESADFLPHLPPIWVAPSLIAGWGIANVIVKRWYE